MVGPISTSMTWPEVYRPISQLLIVPFLVIKLNEATPSSAEILFGLITKTDLQQLYFPHFTFLIVLFHSVDIPRVPSFQLLI